MMAIVGLIVTVAVDTVGVIVGVIVGAAVGAAVGAIVCWLEVNLNMVDATWSETLVLSHTPFCSYIPPVDEAAIQEELGKKVWAIQIPVPIWKAVNFWYVPVGTVTPKMDEEAITHLFNM